MQLIPCYSTAIGTFIFDSRLGLLDDPPRDEPERFVKATQDFLHYTQELRSGPPFYKIMETPAWKGFCKASDFLIEAGKKYVEEKEKQLSERAAKEVDIPDKRGTVEPLERPPSGYGHPRVMASGRIDLLLVDGDFSSTYNRLTVMFY